MSDKKTPTDDTLPAWSVRGVPGDIRGAVLTHAKRAGIGAGEWLTLAVREKIKADRAGGRNIAKRGPVSMSEASAVVDMLSRLSGAGVELPTSLQRSAVSMVRKVTQEVSKGQTSKPDPTELTPEA